jgi:hypothetical protein
LNVNEPHKHFRRWGNLLGAISAVTQVSATQHEKPRGLKMTGIEMKLPGDIWESLFSGVQRRLHALGSKPRVSVALREPQNISEALSPPLAGNLPFDARTAALANALNADRGVRARAVHLVIVEQTLRQGVAGGLSAVPPDVLEKAIAQLRGLSLFCSSLELQRLCQSMRVTRKAQTAIADVQRVTGNAANRVLIELPDGGQATREFGAGRPPRRSPEPPQSHPSERSSGEDDNDDFPDTQAFDDHEEILLPLPPTPPVDRGAVMGVGGLWR